MTMLFDSIYTWGRLRSLYVPAGSLQRYEHRAFVSTLLPDRCRQMHVRLICGTFGLLGAKRGGDF